MVEATGTTGFAAFQQFWSKSHPVLVAVCIYSQCSLCCHISLFQDGSHCILVIQQLGINNVDGWASPPSQWGSPMLSWWPSTWVLISLTNALSTLTVGVLTAWGQRGGEGMRQGYTLTDCLHIVDTCLIAAYANHPARGQQPGVPVTQTQDKLVSSPIVT